MINYSSGRRRWLSLRTKITFCNSTPAHRETGWFIVCRPGNTPMLRSVRYNQSDIRSFIKRFKADLRECCRGTTGDCQPRLFVTLQFTVQYIYISDIWLELLSWCPVFMCLVSGASVPAETSSTGYFWPSLPRPDFPPGRHWDWRPAWRGSSPAPPAPGTLPWK